VIERLASESSGERRRVNIESAFSRAAHEDLPTVKAASQRLNLSADRLLRDQSFPLSPVPRLTHRVAPTRKSCLWRMYKNVVPSIRVMGGACPVNLPLMTVFLRCRRGVSLLLSIHQSFERIRFVPKGIYCCLGDVVPVVAGHDLIALLVTEHNT
jgi:hypothetical protein